MSEQAKTELRMALFRMTDDQLRDSYLALSNFYALRRYSRQALPSVFDTALNNFVDRVLDDGA